MRVGCPACKTIQEVPTGAVPLEGLELQCVSCSARFRVRLPPIEGQAKIPLPAPEAQGGASQPAPSAQRGVAAPPPAVPLPGAARSSSPEKIPLPGAAGDAAAPPRPQTPRGPSGSIPLPGGGVQPPSEQAAETFTPSFGATPLPTFGDLDLGVPVPAAPGAAADELDFGQEGPGLSGDDLFGEDFDPLAMTAPPFPEEPTSEYGLDGADAPRAETAAASDDDFSFEPPPNPSAGPDLELTLPPFAEEESPAPRSSVEDEILAFMEETPLPPPPAPPPSTSAGLPAEQAAPMFHVRRKNGKRIGPFELETILRLLRQDQLDGSEEISESGDEWRSIGELPEVSQIIRLNQEASRRPRSAPVLAPVLRKPEERGEEVAEGGEGGEEDGDEAQQSSRWLATPVKTMSRKDLDQEEAAARRKRRLLIFSGAAALALSVVGVVGYMYYQASAEKAALAAQTTSLASQVRASLSSDEFNEGQSALRLAEELTQLNPDDPVAQALQARVAFTLERRFGAGGPAANAAKAKVGSLGEPELEHREWRLAAIEAGFTFSKELVHREWLEGELASKPGDTELLIARAEGARYSGDAEGAAAWFGKLLEASPKSAFAMRSLGELALERGAADEAVRFFEQALEARPQHAASALALAKIAEEAGKLDEAYALLERALEKEALPTLPPGERVRARLSLARAALRQRKPTEAQAALEGVLQLDGRNTEARLLLSRFLNARGKYQEVTKLLASKEAQVEPLLSEAIHALLAQGKEKEATALLEPALKEPVKVAQLHFLHGQVLAASAKSGEARAAFQRALELQPDHVAALVELARMDGPERREASLQVLEAAAEAGSESVALFLALGELQLEAGEVEAALASFDRAASLDPVEALAQVGRGRAFEAKGDAAEAMAALEEAIALNQDSAEARFALGKLLWRDGEWEQALEPLQRAHELAPRQPQIAVQLAAALIDGENYDGALSALDKALTLDDSLAGGHLYRAIALQAKKDLRRALIEIERALTLDPHLVEAHYRHGLILEEAGRPGDALIAFGKLLEFRGDHADALEAQGRTLVFLGQTTEAIRSYEKAMAADPERSRLLEPVADLYARNRAFSKAIATYREAEKSGSKGISFKLARVYQTQGKVNEAIALLRQAAQEDPDHGEVFRFLGYAYKEKNQLGDARNAFRSYLEKSPDAEDRAEILDEIATLR